MIRKIHFLDFPWIIKTNKMILNGIVIIIWQKLERLLDDGDIDQNDADTFFNDAQTFVCESI